MSAPVRKYPFLVTGCLSFLVCAVSLSAEEPIQLRERFSVGYEYHVSTRVELFGHVDLACSFIPSRHGRG